MSESERPDSKADFVRAVGEVLDKVPVYQDAMQPAVKELGKGLLTVAKAVNVALSPMAGLVWGYEQIQAFVQQRVTKKLENVPAEDITPPKPHIGVPALEALRYTGPDPDLSELYANLLATSMDRITASRAHPSFVEVVKNMCPDEAKILRFAATTGQYPIVNIKLVSSNDSSFHIVNRYVSFIGSDAKLECQTLAPSYLDNLQRLGVIEIDPLLKIADKSVYDKIRDDEVVKRRIEALNKTDGYTAQIEETRFVLTDFGRLFIKACVVDKDCQARE